tara:strand:- start:169 stop:333 length:165 start_codon:yes stop_codon:yes gene_type:complete
MIKSEKVIPIYSNGHGILEVIEELKKGARELGKLTLEEQMERIKERQTDSAVVK